MHAQFVALGSTLQVMTCEQVPDLSIFGLVFVPKELLNKLLVFDVVMNLIMYRESESHNQWRIISCITGDQSQGH